MILVSACLIGENCKYNGENNLNKKLIEFLKNKEYISVCPEAISGLGTPRDAVEIVKGEVLTKEGISCTKEFEIGINKVLKEIEDYKIDYAVLQSRSPSCGVNKIYDGSFSGVLIEGKGKFAQALENKNIKTIDIEDMTL